MLISIAWRSLVSRRKTVFLTFLSLLVSISMLLSVEHIRLQAKESFNRAISGVDLIVGAPSGELNLLLYSIFRMGSPTNNMGNKPLLTVWTLKYLDSSKNQPPPFLLFPYNLII